MCRDFNAVSGLMPAKALYRFEMQHDHMKSVSWNSLMEQSHGTVSWNRIHGIGFYAFALYMDVSPELILTYLM